MTTESNADEWFSRDRPVLQALARHIAASPFAPNSGDIATAHGIIPTEGAKAMRALRPAYLRGLHVTGTYDGGLDAVAEELTAAGKRALAIWPTPETVLGRLADAIEQQLATATTRDERRALNRMRDGLADLPQQIGVGLAMAVAGGVLG